MNKLTIKANSKVLNPYFSNVKVTKEVDGLCSFSFDYPKTDNDNSVNLIVGNSIEILYENENIITGVILNTSYKVTNNENEISVSGVSALDRLRNIYLPPNVLHNEELVTDVLNPAFSNSVFLDTGWTVTLPNSAKTVTYLNSLQSSLSAIKSVLNLSGLHFRYLNDKNIEFFENTTESGITVQFNSDNGCFDVGDKTLMLNGGINIDEDRTGLYNYAYVVGGTSDNGMNQLTLRDVNPAEIDPLYPILNSSIVPNTDAVYDNGVYANTESAPNTYTAFVISNSVSVNKYGKIEKAISRKDIHPVTADTKKFLNTDRVVAATQLYKASVEDMKLNGEPKKTISFNATGGYIALKAGDSIRLKIKKDIINSGSGNQGGYGNVIDIDQDFILAKYTLSFEKNNEINYDFELSNLTKIEKGDIEILADTIKTVDDYQKQRKGSVAPYPTTIADSFDNLNPLKGFLFIPENFTYVDKLNLKINIRPFRSYSKGATSVATATTTSTTTTAAVVSGNVTIPAHSHDVTVGNHTHDVTIGNHTHGVTVGNHTHDVTVGNHTHDIIMVLGNSTTGSAVFYAPASPPFRCAGGGTILGDYTSGAGGGTTVTSAGGGSATVTSAGGGSATVTSAAGGGTSTTSSAGGSGNFVLNIPSLTVNPAVVNIPSIPINIEYGIFEDIANPPTELKLFIDGIDFSGQVAIPDGFAISPTASSDTYDIMKAADLLNVFQSLFVPGYHEIELRCATGKARADLHFQGQYYVASK